MKARLLDQVGNIFELSGSQTTIGKDDSDIVLQFPNIEIKHAVIQMREDERCLILQDLNTSHGCYVNGTRVQNAAVQLADGDLIGFGYSNPVFKLQVEHEAFEFVYPGLGQSTRQVYENTPLRFLTGTRSTTFLPYLPVSTTLDDQVKRSQQAKSLTQSVPITTLAYSPVTTTKPSVTTSTPRPPLRVRPASAGAPRSKPSSVNSKLDSGLSLPRGSWMKHDHDSDTPTDSIVEQLEERLVRMGDELSRLASYESECHRKDHVISELREEIVILKRHEMAERNAEFKENVTEILDELHSKEEFEESHKFAAFQAQIHQRNQEIALLKERLDRTTQTFEDSNRMRKDTSTNTIASLRTQLAERQKDIARMKNELDQSKKEQIRTTSRVKSLEKESTSKETLLHHAKNDINKLKKTLKEKETLLAQTTAKLTRQKGTKEAEIEQDELLSVRAKLKSCQKQLQEKNNVIAELQREIEQCGKDVEDALKVSKKELEKAKSDSVDTQREVQRLKTELKQREKRLDKISKQVIEAVVNSGCIKGGHREIDDEKVVDFVHQLSDDRMRLIQRLNEISELKEKKMVEENALKFAQTEFEHYLNQVRTTLSNSRRNLSTLQLAVVKLNEHETGKEHLQWVKNVCLNFLKDELACYEKDELFLQEAGYDQERIKKGMPKIIAQLQEDMQVHKKKCKKLEDKILSMNENHELTISRLREELSLREGENIATAVREARMEETEKRLEMIKQFEEKQGERIEAAISSEKSILQSQLHSLEQLKKALDAKNEECEQVKISLSSVQIEHQEEKKMLEEAQNSQAELLKDLEEKCSLHNEKISDLEAQLAQQNADKENELKSYKEQCRQHSLTIVALEERLLRLSKQNKLLEQDQHTRKQLTQVKQSLLKSGKKSSSNTSAASVERSILPSQDEKPVKDHASVQTTFQQTSEEFVKAEVLKLERLVVLLRQEAVAAKKEKIKQSNVVTELKRDLAGARTRLSDVKSEMNDQQKQNVEELKQTIEIQEKELQQQREHLKQLSVLVNQQKEQISRYISDVSETESCGGENVMRLDRHNKKNKEGPCTNTAVTQQIEESSNEMCTIAEHCLNGKHTEIIAKQKEALQEMRHRVKELEKLKTLSKVPNHEHVLRQVTALQNELNELRQAEANREKDFNRSASELQQELRRNQQEIAKKIIDMEIEKSAHVETKNALEKSEQTYLNLVRYVAKLLDVDDFLTGCQTMAHLSPEERQRLAQEREKSHEMIRGRLHSLMKHLKSKKELLKDYNKDLKKLREAEMIAGRKSAEFESLLEDFGNQNLETSCLREMLNRTQEELGRQRTLNR